MRTLPDTSSWRDNSERLHDERLKPWRRNLHLEIPFTIRFILDIDRRAHGEGNVGLRERPLCRWQVGAIPRDDGPLDGYVPAHELQPQIGVIGSDVDEAQAISDSGLQ